MNRTGNVWLRVSKLSKHFGAVIALEAVDAGTRLGEVLALGGDNGAGKSTLVKLRSGAYSPSAGQITIDESPVRTTEAGQSRRPRISSTPGLVAQLATWSISRRKAMQPTRLSKSSGRLSTRPTSI